MSLEHLETLSDLMWCRCTICGEVFEARYRSTTCPHKPVIECLSDEVAEEPSQTPET